MKHPRIRKLSAWLLTAVLLFSILVPAAGALTVSSDTITISSEADFEKLADSCSLDTWSRGKTVVLTADLNLTAIDFTSIPTFGGTFDGAGHTISGFHLTVSGSARGLFRYLQSGAVVENLTVCGSAAPGGTRNSVGGIVGENAGTVRNCTFSGTVSGAACVGGIAGVNQESGIILDCTSEAAVSGVKNSGGIAGKNLGTIQNCINTGSVDSSPQENSVSLKDLTLDTSSALDVLTTPDAQETVSDTAAASHTDAGGIAGYSSGLILNCSNSGTVGYVHMGYNVGGIVGRQAGYLADCRNSGPVYGRKDVGGIAGQMEPYIIINLSSGSLDQLEAELQRLQDVINRALDDSDDSASRISSRLTALSGYAGSARESSQDLLNQTSDFLDGNLGEINRFSALLSNTLRQMDPILSSIKDASDATDTALDQGKDALDALTEVSADGKNVLADARQALADLQDANDDTAVAVKTVRTALNKLADAVSAADSDTAAAAVKDLAVGFQNLADALSSASSALDALKKALNSLSSWDDLANSDTQSAILAALGQFSEAAEAAARALSRISGDLAAVTGNVQVDWTEIQTAAELLPGALQDVQNAAGHIQDAADSLQDAFTAAEGFSKDVTAAFSKLSDMAGTLSHASASLTESVSSLRELTQDLADESPLTLTGLGDSYRQTSRSLYGALNGLTGEMNALNTTVTASSKTLTSDLRAVSRQFSVVMQLLLDSFRDLQSGTSGTNLSDLIEDTSDQDIAATRLGKVTACINSGEIQADRNVGGIAGSMAVEYDLDPEDDTLGDTALNATYETKAVLQGCINRGTVTGKKDCIGGGVGRTDLGTVLDCQNYADVSSTSGNYVGGIVGLSSTTVRRCYAKCSLSGQNDIGGIAGSAVRLRDCCAIVQILEGQECLGAIAGTADPNADAVSGNCFVPEGVAAIDGISYSGMAEPVEFEVLAQNSTLPTEFLSFSVTFRADGNVLKTVPVSYGDRLYAAELPRIPEKDGSYGSWPAKATAAVQSDVVVDAEYDVWITALASPETQPGTKKSLALAEGQFSSAAVLHVADSAVPPPAEQRTGRTVSVWELVLQGSGCAETDQIPLRLLHAGAGKAAIYEYQDGAWVQIPAAANGQYLQVTMSGTTGTFCVVSTDTGSMQMLLLAVGAAAVLVLLILLRGRHTARKKKPDSKAEQAK